MSLHHLHKRKRMSGRALHPFPAESAGLRFLDKAVYLAGLVSLVMMVPQLRLIFVERNASDLEPISWLTFALMDIPWIIYGFMHKEKPLMFIYSVWLVVNSLVFVGAVLY